MHRGPDRDYDDTPPPAYARAWAALAVATVWLLLALAGGRP